MLLELLASVCLVLYLCMIILRGLSNAIFAFCQDTLYFDRKKNG